MQLTKVLAVAAIAIVGCKGKEPSKQERAPAPAPPPPPNPVEEPAKFLAGKPPALGCVAWSSRLKAVACVTGSILNDEPRLELEQLGEGVAAATRPLGSLDDKAAATADAALIEGGYRPLPGGIPVAEGKAAIVKTTTLMWQRKETSAGGDNQAPAHETLIVARCKGAEVELLRVEAEGDQPAVTVQSAGDDVLVELKMKYAREGERGEDFAAAVLRPSTCTVTRTN